MPQTVVTTRLSRRSAQALPPLTPKLSAKSQWQSHMHEESAASGAISSPNGVPSRELSWQFRTRRTEGGLERAPEALIPRLRRGDADQRVFSIARVHVELGEELQLR